MALIVQSKKIGQIKEFGKNSTLEVFIFGGLNWFPSIYVKFIELVQVFSCALSRDFLFFFVVTFLSHFI